METGQFDAQIYIRGNGKKKLFVSKFRGSVLLDLAVVPIISNVTPICIYTNLPYVRFSRILRVPSDNMRCVNGQWHWAGPWNE